MRQESGSQGGERETCRDGAPRETLVAFARVKVSGVAQGERHRQAGMRASWLGPLVTALVVVAGGQASWADEEASLGAEPEPWNLSAATHLGGGFGLTGFGTMIDGRVPSPLLTNPALDNPLGASSNRVSLRYDLLLRQRELRGANRRYRLRQREEALSLHYGLSVRGLDLAISLPYRREETRLGPAGRSEGTLRAEGLGGVTLGAKLALRIPEFFFGDWAVAAFAPYALAHTASGAERVSDPGWVEAGLALAGPYGYSFRWIGNFGLRHHEGGLTSAIYRFGASFVPLASAGRTLRVYAHFAGVEFEGRPNSDVDLEGGAQLLIGGLVTVDLGLSYRVVDSGYTSRRFNDALSERYGEVPRGWHGDQAFTLTFALGVVL